MSLIMENSGKHQVLFSSEKTSIKKSIMLKESNKTFTNNPKPLVINSVVTFCKTLT